MSFSPDWLDLRENADHLSRNMAVFAKISDYLQQDTLNIVDIGGGTGSNFRGLSQLLKAKTQHWTIVDYDQTLLDVARQKFTQNHANNVTLNTLKLDLMQDLEKVIALKPDLITASAFFDLTSKAWINRFVSAVTKAKIPFYTILTYDGHEEWHPTHPLDASVLASFHADQHRDKGFGNAAGPNAHQSLEQAFKLAGYKTFSGKSPWILENDRALIEALAKGSASALKQLKGIEAWRDQHIGAKKVIIGHDDLVALPL